MKISGIGFRPSKTRPNLFASVYPVGLCERKE